MKNITEFINPGILEAYVLGMCDAHDAHEIEELAAISIEIRNKIDILSEALEKTALANAVMPDPIIRPMLLATIDYMERMKNGEQPTFPPMLHEESSIEDYEQWLTRADMVMPADFKDIHAKIIGHTQKAMTAIVWIKEMVPQEMHDNEFEKFLILEGTCQLIVGDEVYNLTAGDFMTIPLNKTHHLKVTSDMPCKAILQRVAA